MLNKFTLFLLISLICTSMEAIIRELPQYGQVTESQQTYLYLSLAGFNSGDKIYIELEFNNGYIYTEAKLGHYQSNNNSSSDFENLSYHKSYTYSRSGYKHTFYFTIELTKNSKYLLLGTPRFTDDLYTTVTVRHTKSSGITVIVIVAIVFMVIIVAIIFACIFILNHLINLLNIFLQPNHMVNNLYIK